MSVASKIQTSNSKPKKPGSERKMGVRNLGYAPPSGAKRVRAFEDFVDLRAIIRYKLQGSDVGAYCLTKGEDIQLKFGFECGGVHPTLPLAQVLPIFEAIESGLKDLPDGESLTLRTSSFTTDDRRQSQLKALQSSCANRELELLVCSERARVRELTDLGIRQPKTLRIFCTYTVAGDARANSQDALGKALIRVERMWQKITGQIHATEHQKLQDLLERSFTEGFQLWEQLLATKMGLSIRPLRATELWGILWRQFNASEPHRIPHLLTLTDSGLRETVASEYNISSCLLEGENATPFFDRSWVHHQQKYVGVMTFDEKPAGWTDEYAELRYLWEILARDRVYDTEIVCQVTRANESMAKTAVQRVTKQSIVSSEIAADKSSVDVGAQLKADKAIDAQRQMLEGAVPLNVACVFLVYRSNRRSLDEACRYISSCFRRPAVVLREKEYAWKIWLQTTGLVLESLLGKPFNRRLAYFSGEAPGFMSWVRTAPVDGSGFELIADEGGTPIHLDFYRGHKNLGVFSTTRGGKSVLISAILTQALAAGMPVVAMDYPKPDGTSTFTDYTQFLGENFGSYFDIGSEASNLFELPDTRTLEDVKVRRERFADYKDFLSTALFTMVLGTNLEGVNPLLVDSVRAVLGFALETFFNDPDIRLRYQQAREAGFGTPEWDSTPTLQDFYQFCSPGFLDLDAMTGGSGGSGIDAMTALEQIQIRLRYWLTSSRVGRAISRPSTFRAEAPLLVFALRNLSNDADAAILSLGAYSAALRRSLSSRASIFFIDESPILFQYESIASLVARLCANGAKSGVRVILSAQEPDSIAQSQSAAKIFANMTVRLVGRIQPSAVPSFEKIFHYPREIIGANATEAFFPKKEGLYSQWMLDYNGRFTRCRFYPGYVQLAAVANNTDEQEMRTRFLQKYPNNRLAAMVEFSQAYVEKIRSS